MKGFALMELMLVIGLIAVASVGAWMIFGPASSATKVQDESNNLQHLAQAIEADYLMAPDRYQSIDSVSTVARNLAPEAWIQDGQLVSASLGTITFQPIASGQGYQISFEIVPQDLCVGMVQENARLFSAVHVKGVLVYQFRTLDKPHLFKAVIRVEK